MKVFAIRDASIDKNRDLAYLLYYEKSKRFYIEIRKDTGEWEAPLLLASFVKKGRFSPGSRWSYEWAALRVVPPERQNLGMILKENRLEEYDIMRLLEISSGRCAQDDCFITPLDRRKLPPQLTDAMNNTLTYVQIRGGNIVSFTRNGSIRTGSIRDIGLKNEAFIRLAAYKEQLSAVRLSEGGHEISICGSEEITSEEIIKNSKDTGIAIEDIYEYMRDSLIDTSEAARIMECSRQNIQDLVKRKRLSPLMKLSGGFLFMKEQLE